jgi:hypothetical protein
MIKFWERKINMSQTNGNVQEMMMVDPIAMLIANLLAIPKVCLAEVGDRRPQH